MSKRKSQYRCSECGAVQLKWAGQCSQCGEWNSLREETAPAPSKGGKRFSGYAGESDIVRLTDVRAPDEPRLSSHLSELDRVLGGGIVPGSVTLIGGDPGIGKSTLLTQMLARLTEAPALYISGEESAHQISLRVQRLSLPVEHMKLLTETSVERIIATAQAERPQVMVIDSIQTLYT